MKKKLIKIVVSALLLCALLTFFVGNYFVNYALLRDAKGGTREVEDEWVVTDHNQQVVQQNKQKQKEASEKFLEETKAESVEISSDDHLKLKGHLAKNDGDTLILIAHGYQTSEKESLPLAKAFYDMGYSTLTIDMRAHGNSEGKFIGMGYFEKYDILNWINFINEHLPNQKIFLHGTSMGGGSVLLAGTLDLPSNVKGIIDDCGYSSAYEMFQLELKKRFNLPSFPVLDMANIMAQIRANYNLKDTDVLKNIDKIKSPVLIIHGDKDNYVPVEMAQRLYDKLPGEKDLLIVEEADHADSKYLDPETYYEKIQEFIIKYSK
ncbi:alpha/beta hydrolase [Allofustis seminis]|uniref:alpha/beta hydrolase n=1 Tax=Allofustis seminis TaxID=166939 RepID=UPI00035D47D8|nr:alpha/beta hydrolase [Allofustis seminis]